MDRVYTGCRKNAITGMVATGIPPHIILANELIEVREELKHLKVEILDKLSELATSVPLSVKSLLIVEVSVT